MNVADVLVLIEAAAKSGVGELKFGDLHVTFSHWPKWKGLDKKGADVQLDGVEDSGKPEPDRAEQSNLDLLLNDPVTYEEQMARGEM